MKYSVLMSVYKYDNADFLKRALASIYEEQTRKPDEIVVVFDGPLTDELYCVLNDFAEDKSNIVYYYPQEVNRGLGEALRIGTQKCTGDYIFRMDSDDISHPERFEKQIAYIEANPDTDVVGTDIAEFYLNPNEQNLRVRACPESHDKIVAMAKKRNPMNHVTVCIKKDSLLQCGGYENLLLLEDYYLWLKMIAAGYVLKNINESLVYVRIGNGFHAKRGSKIRISGWKILQKYMYEKGLIKKREAIMNMVYIRVFTYCPPKIKKWIYDKLLRK